MHRRRNQEDDPTATQDGDNSALNAAAPQKYAGLLARLNVSEKTCPKNSGIRPER